MTIIGVAGGTGSGKTTVVSKIAESLPPHYVSVVALDAYYKDESKATPEERKSINVDHPDAFDWPLLIAHVRELKSGRAIEMPVYSYAEFSRLPQTVCVEPRPVVIVEGILILSNPQLRKRLDIKVFVDADSDDRLMRIIRRDIHERNRTYEQALSHYADWVKPMHEQFIEPTKRYADIIVPQGGENEKAIGIISSHLHRYMQRVREENSSKKKANA